MRVFLAAVGLVLASCGAPETLRVRQFHLTDTEASASQPFIRAEMNKRLHGAVTEEERELRKGDYYHIRWHGLSGTNPVRVVFEFRQVRTGSKIFKMEKMAEPSREGDRQFRFWGENHRRNGRVQSWRVSLFDGKNLVAQKQSYLWE